MSKTKTQPKTGTTILPPPLPLLDRAVQPGVTDPVWGNASPPHVDPEVYKEEYAGTLERQRHLHIITADVEARSRADLKKLLTALTGFAQHQMAKPPVRIGEREYDAPISSRRVTVTVGFGVTLFTTLTGEDRFGLAAQKPTWLKPIPRTEGDDHGFDPAAHAADLVILVASDDFYVNEYIFGRLLYRSFAPKLYGSDFPPLRVRGVERGYARPDNREPSGFEDGLTNPKDTDNPNDPEGMHALVYVRDADEEPEWCVDGTYLAYRKVGRQLRAFFNEMNDRQREAVFGVHRTTGVRHAKPAPNAHSPKMNPRRKTADLLGVKDGSRRFLRRPYFFTEGVAAGGAEMRGLHHLSFARNLGYQYEWPVHMWQMNKDFPNRGDGIDALYEVGGARNVGGGYFFVPAAPSSAKGDFFGSALLR
jgi:deferrochelatase/peroxidase EfeB